MQSYGSHIDYSDDSSQVTGIQSYITQNFYIQIKLLNYSNMKICVEMTIMAWSDLLFDTTPFYIFDQQALEFIITKFIKKRRKVSTQL
ncbi:unnamed protein product [Paramecium octaurelia]|uniref:Uncharacterized protein n=1 Tax=Paramecium octaurelia TaxID=43137 RepID=A0A8S1U4E1_PAROT|nr:unnamed protein product [Paramecium octaurelia]